MDARRRLRHAVRLRLPVLLLTVALAACQPGGAPPDRVEPSSAAAAPSAPLQRCKKGSGAAPARLDPSTRHAWSTVAYPRIDVPWGLGGKATVMLGFGGDRDAGLRFDLILSGPGTDSEARPPEPAPGDVQVVLHTPQGMIRPSCGDATVGAWAGGSLGTSGDMIFVFPWQSNDMLDGFVQIRLPAATYWLAVPYGFTRDPRAPLPKHPSSLERPAAPPEAPDSRRPATFLRWERVTYDLGAVGPAEGISVSQENAADATTTVTLYRENGGWNVASPRISVERVAPSGARTAAAPLGASLGSDTMRRVDRFRFQAVTEPAGRFWATLIVHVDDKDVSALIPSSLFKTGHGAAEAGGTR